VTITRGTDERERLREGSDGMRESKEIDGARFRETCGSCAISPNRAFRLAKTSAEASNTGFSIKVFNTAGPGIDSEA
jgi:hypothetical protein